MVALVSIILVLLTAVFRLRLMGDILLPIGYGIPIIIFVWLNDRRYLWGAAISFAAISSIQFIQRSSSSHPLLLSPSVDLLMQLTDLAFVATVVHIVIGLRGDIETQNQQLARSVESLTAKEEEIARQNEELQSQTEELERQSEELRIANDDLAAREKTLEHLLALSRSLMNELTRDQVLQHVCEALGFLMGSRAAASAILERRDNDIVASCHHGFGPEGVVSPRLPFDQAFSTVVLNRSQTAYLEDVAMRPDLHTLQPKAGEPIRSILATPLRIYGRPVGTLEVYSRQPGTWSEEHVALLESLAAQTSISLEAATLFEDIDRERRRFEAVFRSLPIGIVVSNEGHTEVRINPSAAMFFGINYDLPIEAADGIKAWRFFRGGQALSRYEYPLWRAVKEKVEAPPEEYELLTPAGQRLTLLGSASPIRDKNGNVVAGVAAFTNITDRKGLERELDQRRREAEESAVRKTRFLAAVSHDIRTPANAINLMAELIRRAATNPAMTPEVPSLAAELQSSATSLVTLVSDVLDLTRFDSGRIELNETEFPLAEAIAEEVRQQSAVAQARNLTLRYEPPATSILIRTDRVKLGRVLGNLIGNAIKFTAAGEVVVSVLVGSDRQIRVHIKDTGIGIDPEHLPRIFDEFFQLRNPERDPSKGTGLGLTICKRLVDAMGGSLLVESESGKGSVFTLILPASSLTPPPAPQSDPVDDNDQDREVRLDGMRILLVEDEHITRAAARRLLEAEGASIAEAATVKEAIQILYDRPLDVLLLDLMLPDGTGADVLKAIRQRRPSELKTIFVLTGDVGENRAAEMRELGADVLIPKPVKLPAILSTLRRSNR